VTVLVVEDHALVRELLGSACAQALPAATIQLAGTRAATLALCRNQPPDLVILDLVLPDGDGLDLVAEIFALAASARIIVLSSHIDEFTLQRAFSSRVHGILDKNEQPVRILHEAIATVMDGRRYVSSAVQRLKASLHADPAAFDKILSAREQSVLRLVGEGLTNSEIAQRLGIGVGTAKLHRLHLMAKLNLHSTPQLIRYAVERGFTRIPERLPHR